MHPKDISIDAYSYELPSGRIASHPLPLRDASRLLVYKDGAITETHYRELAREIPAGSLMFFNDTRVVEARILFRKETGGIIEIFCLEPEERYPDIHVAMQQTGAVYWKCLIGGASKWKPGQLLRKETEEGSSGTILTASYVEKRNDCFVIRLSWEPAQLSFSEVLHRSGKIPLPPYIKREPGAEDRDRYQTVYAHTEGSVAAPTAGLHFTEHVLQTLREKNVDLQFLTLHVGAGTFMPVKSATMENHDMHAEFIEVNRATIEHLLKNDNQPVITVGTTSLRTIESLYWLGTLVAKQPGIGPEALWVPQWLPYETETNIPPRKALESLLHWMETHGYPSFFTRTQILLAPGYRFRLADALITNFHQPHSTLLLLVAAFIGDDWKNVYAYALDHGFRFLSYGDGSLLWRMS